MAGWRSLLKTATESDVRKSVKEPEVREALQKIFSDRVEFDVPMSRYTSLRVGGPADALVFPKDREEIVGLLQFLSDHRIPYGVVGKGSNLIVRDGGIRGVVLDLSEGFSGMERDSSDPSLVIANAGESLPRLVHWASDQGLSGIESLIGIPGMVGGALMMNAGIRDGEIGDVVQSVEWMESNGEIRDVSKESLRFEYRHFEIPKGAILLSAKLRLKKGDPIEIQERMKKCLEKRHEPKGFPSAGCIFKNPPNDFAGRLIDQAGLKGVRIRGAQVSDVHANYIVNVGSATARDILSLIDLIRERIREEHGISLELEVKVMGEASGKD
ncbi:MAG: UDP-N-acetylmuramate dehydrogenase [Deltaproteobacteria bacterium]|nr:UDP-N-acetylmuramate dehydrogenase [Deltaproteobacteria bacterium]